MDSYLKPMVGLSPTQGSFQAPVARIELKFFFRFSWYQYGSLIREGFSRDFMRRISSLGACIAIG